MTITTDLYNHAAKENAEVMDELSKLKEAYKEQCNVFIYEVQKLNQLINDQIYACENQIE